MLETRHKALALTLGIGMAAPSSFAAVNNHHDSIVYVMTNAADHNEVVAYAREHDGRTLEAGRFSTEGRGSGGTNDPLQSQGSLALSPDHRFLFAVNAGSGTVTSFLIGPRGRLLLTDKISSGGSEPLAVVSLQNRVYVLDGAGAGTVVGYTVNDFGQLRALPHATAFLSGTSAGGSSISISPDGRLLVVTERLTNSLDTFPIQYDGSLGPLKVTPSPVPGIFSGRFDPAGAFILSSTGPAGISSASTISSFSIAGDGTLSAVTQSLPTFGNANCWNAVTPNGRFAYVSNAGSSTISGFSIGKGGVLQPLNSTIVATQIEGTTNLDVAVSEDGEYLYTLNSMVGSIGVFKINSDGSLTPEKTIEGLEKNVGYNGIAAL